MLIGLDCHPDTFTAAVVAGQTPHNARKVCARENITLEALMEWAKREFSEKDLFVMEASGNSFAVCKRLRGAGLRAIVLESAWVGRQAKKYADNDKMAAMRIAKVYLSGDAPAVWVPDETTFGRRELLHAYRKAVADHTAATNSLKAYLNGHAIRLGKRKLELEPTREWIRAQRQDWSELQKALLMDYFANIDFANKRRQELYQRIAIEVGAEPMMLRCMKVLGVGIVNAFALMAVIGDVRRFESPQKLVAYVGLNPGQRTSGNGKMVKVGVGRRGRGDLRHLLVQGAQAVLRMGKASAMGQWGWKLFCAEGQPQRGRRGNRPQTAGSSVASAHGQSAHRAGERQESQGKAGQGGGGLGHQTADPVGLGKDP
jgi:transposase